ncbi:hypothetical protein NM688_g7698 [Phlebia brevispora]|uniref:Uncharacterized protein n=1 Tax=Phlebia brevispora TaxID=194682 RepID=A0ACC1S2C6_9APHY|nr:hypothetical protein NM688_g7698 [Phlebia brevispora]
MAKYPTITWSSVECLALYLLGREENKELRDLLLERIKDALLCVYGLPAISNKWHTEFLDTNMSKIWSLDLGDPPYSYLEGAKNKEAPEMRTLTIHDSLLILPHIWARTATKLSVLMLYACRLEYHINNYRNLTVLHLEGVTFGRREEEEGNVLTLIANSPDLQELYLHSDTASDDEYDWDPKLDGFPSSDLRDQRWKLAHLNSLTLDMPLVYMLLVLGSVDLPAPDTLKHIECVICKLSERAKGTTCGWPSYCAPSIPPIFIDKLFDCQVEHRFRFAAATSSSLHKFQRVGRACVSRDETYEARSNALTQPPTMKLLRSIVQHAILAFRQSRHSRSYIAIVASVALSDDEDYSDRADHVLPVQRLVSSIFVLSVIVIGGFLRSVFNGLSKSSQDVRFLSKLGRTHRLPQEDSSTERERWGSVRDGMLSSSSRTYSVTTKWLLAPHGDKGMSFPSFEDQSPRRADNVRLCTLE